MDGEVGRDEMEMEMEVEMETEMETEMEVRWRWYGGEIEMEWSEVR